VIKVNLNVSGTGSLSVFKKKRGWGIELISIRKCIPNFHRRFFFPEGGRGPILVFGF
jgi:hypothetical protein